jgi:hypothetical protein
MKAGVKRAPTEISHENSAKT